MRTLSFKNEKWQKALMLQYEINDKQIRQLTGVREYAPDI